MTPKMRAVYELHRRQAQQRMNAYGPMARSCKCGGVCQTCVGYSDARKQWVDLNQRLDNGQG